MEGSPSAEASTPSQGQPEAQAETQKKTSPGGEALQSPEGSTETPKPEPRKAKWKVRLDGKDHDDELDEETIRRDYQKWRASGQRFEQASALDKQAKQTLERIKKEPWRVLEEQGLNPYEAAEQLLIQKMQFEALSPAERRSYELEQQNKYLEEQLNGERASKKEIEEGIAKQEQEALELKTSAELGTNIVDALKATGVKATPRLVSRIAEVMLSHYQMSLDKVSKGELDKPQRLSATEAVRYAQRALAEDAAIYMSEMPLDDVKKLLPKQFFDGLRKSDLEQVRSQDPTFKASPKETTQAKVRQNLKRGTTDQIFDQLIESRLKS